MFKHEVKDKYFQAGYGYTFAQLSFIGSVLQSNCILYCRILTALKLTERIQRNSFLFFFLVVLSLDDGWGWVACKLNPPLQKGADIERGAGERNGMLLFQLNRCNTTPAVPPCVRCWKLYSVSE